MNHNLKMCACGDSHQYGCARCNQTFCLLCDCPVDAKEVKTIVRYCPDWRCQRERKIDMSGELVVVPRSSS